MNNLTGHLGSHRFKIILAFASIYLLWGSTFLFIKFAIETIPPFFMAGFRHIVAGAILYLFARRGEVAPNRKDWQAAIVIGGLLLFVGNGGVTWAEQHVPSGLTALIVASIPIWMVVMNWLFGDRIRPGKREIISLILGFLGLIILVGPERIIGSGQIDLSGLLVLILAAVAWSAGSLYARRHKLSTSQLLATGMQSLGGGALLIILGLLSGESQQLHADAISLRSFLSLGYLTVFGSLIGFTSYIWLLKQVSPAKVSTYAYVNPVIAVFLGWLLGGEELTLRTLLCAAVIISAVMIATIRKPQKTNSEEQILPQKVQDEAIREAR
jgi:drug/metabolite transporter (DMT)-like permease